MLLIEFRPQEPIVKLLRAVGEEKDCQKIERHRGKNGQEHPHCAQSQANAAKSSKNVLSDLHICLSLLSTFVEMTCRLVAMYFAIGAECFRFHKGTFIAALPRVFCELGAFRT